MATKYLNKKTVHDGEKFDSKRELARWLQLKLMERAGQITDLRRQVDYVLAPAVVLDGHKKPALRYRADHAYTITATGEQVTEDVKGMVLPLYRAKRHLMKSVLGIEVKEIF